MDFASFRYMFWTDWGEFPKIERAGMDGSQDTRSVIVDYNIYWPNGLAVDYEESRLYWADAKLSYIHSCDYLGGNREVVTEENLIHPFSLTFYNDTLYWTDWSTNSIQSYNQVTGAGNIILEKVQSPMEVRAFMASRQPSGRLSSCIHGF